MSDNDTLEFKLLLRRFPYYKREREYSSVTDLEIEFNNQKK